MQSLHATRSRNVSPPPLHVHEYHPRQHPNNPTQQSGMANTQTTPLPLYNKKHIPIY